MEKRNVDIGNVDIGNVDMGKGTGRHHLTKLALLVTILTLTMLAGTVTVSAGSLSINFGEPKRNYNDVYGTPWSTITYPELTITSWCEKIYYLFMRVYPGQGLNGVNTVDLPIGREGNPWGAKAEFTGQQTNLATGEPVGTGDRYLIYRFADGISKESMVDILRNHFFVRTQQQQYAPFGINVYISDDVNDRSNTTGDPKAALSWDTDGLNWKYDTEYDTYKWVNFKLRSSKLCNYDKELFKKNADYGEFTMTADSTKKGSKLVSVSTKPTYPDQNCFYIVVVADKIVGIGYGNQGDPIGTVTTDPKELSPNHVDTISGKIGGGNCSHSGLGGGVDVGMIWATWRYKGKIEVDPNTSGNVIHAFTIPKQYPINVSYTDRYNWQNVPNPKDETVLFRPSWIENPYAWTYNINSSNLTKTGYTWDKRWYGSSDTFSKSQSLGYKPLYDYWQRAGSQYGWVNGLYCRLLPLSTKNNTPHEYDIIYKDNSSWNAPADTTQHMVYDQTYNLNQNQYTRNTGEKSNGALVLDGYSFSGWTIFQDQSGTSPTFKNNQVYSLDGTDRGLYSSDLLGNSCSVKNLTSAENGKIYLYPNFRKEITVGLNLNNPGATFQGNIVTQKSRVYTMYNRESTTINLSDLTNGLPIYGYPKMFGDWKRSNGLNDMWQKSVISTNEGGPRGTAYRMIGLSTVPTRTSTQNEILYPSSKSYVTPYNFSTYNKRHATQIEIVNDIELYELWEPELALQSSATGAGIKTVETPRFSRHTGTQYLDLKLPAGTKITTEHLIDGVEPFQTGPELTITRLYPQKFSDMYTKAFQSQYPTLTDKLNTLQTFTDNETKVSNIKNTYRENEIFSIPTYLDTAEYNRLTGQAYDKNAVYTINYTVEQPSDFTKWVYGEPNERLSTCIRVQLPTADTEPGDESGGGGGADNTPNKVRLHLNLHTKDETN